MKIYVPYEFNVKEIKQRLKYLRCERRSKKITQVQVAEGIHIDSRTSRTAVTNWENTNNQTLPDLGTLVDLCNFFEADMDYILGRSSFPSKDINTIADTLHLSCETLDVLQNNASYGPFLNSIIHNDLFSEIVKRTQQLSYHYRLKEVISTSFTEDFAAAIHRKFQNLFYSIFPMDMSLETFKGYLKKSIPYSADFDAADFLATYFLKDRQAFVRNQVDDFFSLSRLEQYTWIIDSIAEISYDYFVSIQIVELSKQKLTSIFTEVMESAIQKEAKELKNRK